MPRIKIVAMDPSLSHFGIAKLSVDVDTLDAQIEDLILCKTAPEDKKTMVKSSDDLRRAVLIRTAMTQACEGAALAIAELPFYSARDYSSAIFNCGVVIGVLSSCPVPLIPVDFRTVKLHAVGHPQASKAEMIEWATNRWPTAPWILTKRGGKMVPTQDNEHLADACAVGIAGTKSASFKQAIAMYRAMAA
jgi:hypothetical protein